MEPVGGQEEELVMDQADQEGQEVELESDQ